MVKGHDLAIPTISATIGWQIIISNFASVISIKNIDAILMTMMMMHITIILITDILNILGSSTHSSIVAIVIFTLTTNTSIRKFVLISTTNMNR